MKEAFTNKKDWLYAACLGLSTSQKIAKLMPTLMRPADLFAMSANKLTSLRFKDEIIAQLQNPDWSRIEADERWLAQENHYLITYDNPAYPPMLKELSRPPLLLYVVGDPTLLMQTQLAMVGSRRPSLAAEGLAYDFAKALVGSDITVTSGLALGIDAKAHAGALAGKGKTIAVVATGLDQVYPARHKSLAQAIVANGGAIVSEHCLNTAPNGKYFPQRNRIISGLSQATLVVEAAVRSGSLVTARHASEQGKDVLAVPGSLHNPMAAGTNSLIKQGAKVVTTVADVLNVLGISQQDGKKASQTVNNSRHLTKEDKKLLRAIGYEVTTVDDIVARCNLPAPTIAGRLVELELQGQVQAMPGGYVQVTGAQNEREYAGCVDVLI